jgi:hypothetical protein
MQFRKRAAVAMPALLMCSLGAAAQEKKLSCEGDWGGRGESACEMRESTMAATGRLEVNAAPNGGIRVAGWDRAEILVRAQVRARADTRSEAGQLLKEVRIVSAAGKVESDGPRWEGVRNNTRSWSVSFEIFVPKRGDLKLETVNGGINVADVTGNIEAGTVNGGLNFARTGGKVKGETVNGGISMDLDGSTWQGEGIDLETVNGGVKLSVPAAYSAQLKASTVHGGVSADFPGADISGKYANKSMNLTLGSGGPLVKLQTVNGGVSVKKKM